MSRAASPTIIDVSFGMIGDLRRKLPGRKLRRTAPQGADMILGLVVGAAALGGGFVAARNFVRRRLRFVDAVQKPAAPLLAGRSAGP